MSRTETIDRLRRIANRAGAPTMDYHPEYVLVEQRASLDWIAQEAAEAIKDLIGEPNTIGSAPPVCIKHEEQMVLYFYDRPGGPAGNIWHCRSCVRERQTSPDATGFSI